MIEEADCVLAGGASGLSAAGGGDFYYEDNATYRKHFGKFAERYGFKGAFEGSFYRWPTAERAGDTSPPSSTPRSRPAAQALQGPRRHSRREGFLHAHHQPGHAVCEALSLGESGQRSKATTASFSAPVCCTDAVWDAVEPVSNMVEAMGDGLEVPTELVPRCPHCGAEAFPWVRGYGNFLQGELYEEQYRKVSDWLDAHARQRILFLELGVGRMTPALSRSRSGPSRRSYRRPATSP